MARSQHFLSRDRDTGVMFKQFWESQKYIIEPTVIVTGIGAIFLSFDLPENLQAKNALMNIKFVWLVLTTLSVIILFYNFWRFTISAEKQIKRQHKIDLTNSISVAVFILLSSLAINLWEYTLALYSGQSRNLAIAVWFSMPFIAIGNFAHTGLGIIYKILISLLIFSLWITPLLFWLLNIKFEIVLFIKYFVIIAVVSAFLLPLLGWLSFRLGYKENTPTETP